MACDKGLKLTSRAHTERGRETQLESERVISGADGHLCLYIETHFHSFHYAHMQTNRLNLTLALSFSFSLSRFISFYSLFRFHSLLFSLFLCWCIQPYLEPVFNIFSFVRSTLLCASTSILRIFLRFFLCKFSFKAFCLFFFSFSSRTSSFCSAKQFFFVSLVIHTFNLTHVLFAE